MRLQVGWPDHNRSFHCCAEVVIYLHFATHTSLIHAFIYPSLPNRDDIYDSMVKSISMLIQQRFQGSTRLCLRMGRQDQESLTRWSAMATTKVYCQSHATSFSKRLRRTEAAVSVDIRFE